MDKLSPQKMNPRPEKGRRLEELSSNGAVIQGVPEKKMFFYSTTGFPMRDARL